MVHGMAGRTVDDAGIRNVLAVIYMLVRPWLSRLRHAKYGKELDSEKH